MKRRICDEKIVRFLITCLLLVGCASTPKKGKIVALNEPGDAKPEFTAHKEEEVHTQASKFKIASIPEDSEDAAVFYYSLGQAYSLDNETEKAVEAYRATLVYDPDSALVKTRLAAELVKLGSFKESKELCESAIKAAPGFLDSYLLLAGIYVATKEYKRAIDIYKIAVKKEPNNRDALLYYGVTLAEVGKFSEAIASLEKLTRVKENAQSQVDEPIAYFYLAKVQQQSGNIKSAIATLKRAIEKRPGFVKAALLLAEIYSTEKQDHLARKVLTEVFEESPDAEIAAQLAETFLAESSYEKAVVYLETLVDEDPSNENLKLKLGLVYWQLKWHEKAQHAFADILSRHPNSNEVLFYMAELEGGQSHLKEALAYYLRISSDYSKYEAAVARAFSIYREIKQFSDAEQFLLGAINKRPDLVSLYPMLAVMYEDQNRALEAKDALELGKSRFPHDENILYYLGFLYDKLGRKSDAFVTMSELLETNPNNANALNFIGYSLIEKGQNLDQAGAYLQKAAIIKPNDPFIIDSLGWFNYKVGNFSLAMKHLERAHSLKPEEAVILEHLADVYLALNLKEKALDAFKQVYAMNSDADTKSRVAAKIANLESALASSDTKPLRRSPAMARPIPIEKPEIRIPASVEQTNK